MPNKLTPEAQDVLSDWSNDTVTDLINRLSVDYTLRGIDHTDVIKVLTTMQQTNGDLIVRLFETVERFLLGMEV